MFSGKELQDQTVNGNKLMLYDYGARNYDPMLGRWFNIDPALQFTNPYIYCANNPVRYIDPDGKRINILMHNDGRPKHYNWEKGTNIWGFYSSEIQKDGTITKVPYEFGSDAIMDLATIALSDLMSGEAGRTLVTKVAEMKEVVTLNASQANKNKYYSKKSEVTWNPRTNSYIPTQKGIEPNIPFVSLGHELAHVLSDKTQTSNNGKWIDARIYGLDQDVPFDEIYTTHIENQIRAEHGLPLRTHYLGGLNREKAGSRIIDNEGRSLYYNIKGTTSYNLIGLDNEANRFKY